MKIIVIIGVMITNLLAENFTDLKYYKDYFFFIYKINNKSPSLIKALKSHDKDHLTVKETTLFTHDLKNVSQLLKESSKITKQEFLNWYNALGHKYLTADVGSESKFVFAYIILKLAHQIKLDSDHKVKKEIENVIFALAKKDPNLAFWDIKMTTKGAKMYKVKIENIKKSMEQ